LKQFFYRTLLVVSTALFAAPQSASAEDTATPSPADGIAFHYVGRVKLNFLDGTGIVYGYVTALSGTELSSVLFKGVPGEATAYLTFRANIQLDPLPPNGLIDATATTPAQVAVVPFLVRPGSWSIYFTANPAHNWDDPSTFSNGQVVATLQRPVEQFSIFPTFSSNAGSANLQSSVPFILGGRVINLRDIAPRGLVVVTSGPPSPLTGSAPPFPVFAASGYAFVSGR
jgi:hypothetical protein